MNIYETEKLVGEYLLFHYATHEELAGPGPLPETHLDFACRTVWEMLPQPVPTLGRVLDLGCAVGRSSFELSQIATEVIGIDYSHAFIAAGQALQAGEALAYAKLEEGHISTPLTARRPVNSRPEVVKFQHGDAQNLPEDMGSFQLVHAANLLCRLPQPQRLLARLPELVSPGGWLILTTPCTWLAEFTPPENWPPQSTLSWLKSSLEPHFELQKEVDIPFLIRETARKFQWTTAMGTLWQRRSPRALTYLS